MNAATVDAFTLAAIHGSLVAIARDMKIMTMRTAYTQLWKEQGDLSCCVMDGEGEIIAQDPNGFPIHVTTMPLQLQGAVAAIGRENLRPGGCTRHQRPVHRRHPSARRADREAGVPSG